MIFSLKSKLLPILVYILSGCANCICFAPIGETERDGEEGERKRYQTRVDSYIFSGATTPIRVKALYMAILTACVNAIRASLSSCESAFITGNAL